MAVRAAGFIIFRRNPQVEYLLMQTSYGQNHWTPPKGHVDEGETDYATALRETEEEAGLTGKDLKIYKDFCRTLEYNVKNKPKVVTYWLAELVDKNKQVKMSNEHQDFKWLNVDEACELSGYKDFANLLKECHKFVCEGL